MLNVAWVAQAESDTSLACRTTPRCTGLPQSAGLSRSKTHLWQRLVGAEKDLWGHVVQRAESRDGALHPRIDAQPKVCHLLARRPPG